MARQTLDFATPVDRVALGSARSPRRRRVVSIRLFISLAAAVLIAVSVTGVGWLAERNAGEALTRETEARLLLEARNLALVSADPLLSEFPELTLMRIVSEMQSTRPDLAFVVVLDHEGKIQGHADVRMQGRRLALFDELRPVPTRQRLAPGDGLFGNDEFLVAAARAGNSGQQMLGTAIVGIRREAIGQILAASRRQIVIFTASLLAAGVLATLFLMSFFLRPVDALRRGLERIGRGDLDTQIALRDRTELGLLADTVDDMAAQLKASRLETEAKEREIIDTQKEVIHTLGEVVEGRSKETANHIVRVGQASCLLARLAGLDEEEADLILLASPMHDVGKIAIPDAILNKPGKLTPSEYDVIKTHTTVGHDFFRGSERRILRAAAVIAHQHHEKWDGSGYPQGLAGDKIHVYGRIVSLVDVFDALRSQRVYKPALSLASTVEIMRKESGRHFDPRLVDLFLQHIDEFEAIHETHGAGARKAGDVLPDAAEAVAFPALASPAGPGDAGDGNELREAA